MSSHRYQRVEHRADDDDDPSIAPDTDTSAPCPIPASPPPSFHSRASSPSSRPLLYHDPLQHSEADQTLADTFGDDEPNSDNEAEVDDRQRLMRGNPTPEGDSESSSSSSSGPSRQRSSTVLPTFSNTALPGGSRVIRSAANDGVFANLAAKPERGEKEDDLPPSYEQAAADATPPYWETTIIAPGMSSDEVYVDGLPVGSFFSFVWNGMISTSFQLIGFLLTYLLHTTHAAKNGSRAGLGLTLVQYGFYMPRSDSSDPVSSPGDPQYVPPDPNSHDFAPGSPDGGSGVPSGGGGISTSEWISYILMVVGWFIFIRAISDYLRARRHEQLVLQSPDRGLPVPIIAEGERPENTV